jgi:hypothetical protein
MELLKHELYKIFNRKSIWIAAVFFMLVLFIDIYSTQDMYSKQFGNMDDFYSSTYQGKEGTVNSEMAAAAQADDEKIFNDPSSFDSSGFPTIEAGRRSRFNKSVQDAEKDQNAWVSQLDEYRQAVETASQKYGKSSFEYRDAALRYNMLKQLPMPGVYFIYPWKEVIQFPASSGFLILVAMILLGISPLFSDEYTTGVDALILSSKQGKRKLARVKIFAGMIYCIAAALLFVLVYTAGSAAVLGTIGKDAPLQSIYFDSPYSLTISQFFLIEILIFVIAGVFFGLLVMLISALSKNALIPFFICGCLIGLPMIFERMGVTFPAPFAWIEDFNYTKLIRVFELFIGYKSYNIFGSPVLYLPVAIVVFSSYLSLCCFLRPAFSNGIKLKTGDFPSRISFHSSTP